MIVTTTSTTRCTLLPLTVRTTSNKGYSYVNGLNAAEEAYAAAESNGDVAKKIELQAALKFHGGGHLVGHKLFCVLDTTDSFVPTEPLALLEELGSYRL